MKESVDELQQFLAAKPVSGSVVCFDREQQKKKKKGNQQTQSLCQACFWTSATVGYGSTVR